MSATMVASLQGLLSTSKPFPIFTPFGPPLDAAPAIDDSLERSGTMPSPSSVAPGWGWGHDSGFWLGRTGAASNRGTAGGVSTGGSVAGSMPPLLDHCYLTEVKRHHIDALRRLIHALDARRVLVFMNHQDRLRDVMHKLASRGLSVGVLHGEMRKQQRQAVLDGFRSGKFPVLLVSDVVARGLDVKECDAVVHLELPTNAAHYAHRAGRTGRMGRPGVVACIVEQSQVFVVNKLQEGLGVPLRACKVTGGRATVIEDSKVKVLGRFEEQALRRAREADAGAAVDAPLLDAAEMELVAGVVPDRGPEAMAGGAVVGESARAEIGSAVLDRADGAERANAIEASWHSGGLGLSDNQSLGNVTGFMEDVRPLVRQERLAALHDGVSPGLVGRDCRA
jgi:hypothetical protein